MKKAAFLLVCSLSVLLNACYSTRDSLQERVQQRRAMQAEEGCTNQAGYQHEYLRDCIEATQLKKGRKSVHILQDHQGRALVVPKTEGDEQMMDLNSVYSVVDITSKEAVIEGAVATEEQIISPAEDMNTEEIMEEALEGNEELSQQSSAEVVDEAPVEELEEVVTLPVVEEKAIQEPTVQETVNVSSEPIVEVAPTPQVTSEEKVKGLVSKINSLLGVEKRSVKKEILPSEEK